MTWREDAACQHTDPAIFDADSTMHHGIARAVCATCPVTAECATYARENSCDGVWGGLLFTAGKPRRERSAA